MQQLLKSNKWFAISHHPSHRWQLFIHQNICHRWNAHKEIFILLYATKIFSLNIELETGIMIIVCQFMASVDWRHVLNSELVNFLQDAEIASIAVVDLSSYISGQAGPSRDVFCECTLVDADFFAARPSLKILQVSWHPGDWEIKVADKI